ncbi:MAG: hypothetical protein ABI763_09980 [Bacteroidota bacterium]
MSHTNKKYFLKNAMHACEFLLPSLEHIPSQTALTALFKISLQHCCKAQCVLQAKQMVLYFFIFCKDKETVYFTQLEVFPVG